MPLLIFVPLVACLPIDALQKPAAKTFSLAIPRLGTALISFPGDREAKCASGAKLTAQASCCNTARYSDSKRPDTEYGAAIHEKDVQFEPSA
jgi:hypothetical protein